MDAAKKFIRAAIPAGFVHPLEKIYRQARGLFWQARYGFPARNMNVIAVTGTNGKTTTCAFLSEILKAAGYKTAVLTTVFYEFNGQKTPNKTHFTIDKQSIVQKFFSRAKKNGAGWVIIEVTSHALDQERIMGVPVEIAIITNLSQDHLDYHGTMEKYAAAKARLLRDFGAKYAVINRDNDWFDFLKNRSAAKVFSFGKSADADARLSGIKVTAVESSASVKLAGREARLSTKLLGEFNIYNAAAGAAAAHLLGVKNEHISAGVASLQHIDGRMEEIKNARGFKVFVDFGITPDAIEQALGALQHTTKGKVRIVFGATGDRDKAKRPLMGNAAAKHADVIYLTDDETYTEDSQQIIHEVYSGIKTAKAEDKTQLIPDRKEAIKKALDDARPGDSVLITGLGHEDSRNMGGKLIPWSDQEVARELLKSS